MVRIAIIGFGKIAGDEHIPAIVGNRDFQLVATAGGRRETSAANVQHYPDLCGLLRQHTGGLDAVAICTPPGPRALIAAECLRAGLDVLMEKPPTTSLGALAELESLARRLDRTLFTAWHSQFAPGVKPAATALRGETVTTLRISWCEDVQKWHPGQDWVFAAGGYGVFDPGINALSIVSAMLPHALIVRECSMAVPANRQSPIAAEVVFDGDSRASFDWRESVKQCWSITIGTKSGHLIELTEGGQRLAVDNHAQAISDEHEYPALYRHFARLIDARESFVDAQPLRIVADAFLLGSRSVTAPFYWASAV